MFCSNKCAQNSDIVRNKQISSCIEHFGCQNPSQSETIKDKRKQTCIKRYGCENPFQSEEIKEKIKETCLERYDCENPFQNKEIQEKQKQTCIERYSVDNVFKSEEIKDKIKETNINRYGCENPMQSEDIQEKVKQTCLERYGNSYYLHSKSYNQNNFLYDEKRKQTCLNEYGTDSYSKTDEFKEKSKQKCLEKYGNQYYSQSEFYKQNYSVYEEKKKQTCLDKYGKPSYSQTDEFKEKRYNTLKKNGTFSTSKIEEQLKLYLDENNISYVYQFTSDQYPFSCDFYFPEKDLYVEIQGSWTHGPHPFTDSEEDRMLLEKWRSKNTKYYNNAIKTWTIRDVRKRETAIKNNLNYLEIFSCDFEFCTNEILKNI